MRGATWSVEWRAVIADERQRGSGMESRPANDERSSCRMGPRHVIAWRGGAPLRLTEKLPFGVDQAYQDAEVPIHTSW